MDFSKAFDVVAHHRFLLKLSQYGIADKLNQWIAAFLQNRRQRVVVGGEHSKWVSVKSGVPQGTVLGPLLFLAYINNLPDGLHCTSRLFADDCVLYQPIHSKEDAKLLQKDLDTLSVWQQKWQMSFNVGKCYLLRIPSSKSCVNTQYTLGNSVLQEPKTHTYLGVDITHNLKWNIHVDRITNSANKTLGFVRRNLGFCTKDTKVTAYKALIRPTLEYCSGVWDPHSVDLVKKVGKIQRRAVRVVFNNYDWTVSVTKLMKYLELDPLSLRRKTYHIN